MLNKMNLLETNVGSLGIRHTISGKLLDTHCFEPATVPSEATCFPSLASSAPACSRLWFGISSGVVSFLSCLPCQHEGGALFEMGTLICLTPVNVVLRLFMWVVGWFSCARNLNTYFFPLLGGWGGANHSGFSIWLYASRKWSDWGGGGNSLLLKMFIFLSSMSHCSYRTLASEYLLGCTVRGLL